MFSRFWKRMRGTRRPNSTRRSPNRPLPNSINAAHAALLKYDPSQGLRHANNVPRRNSSLHRRNSSLHTGMENYDPSQGLRHANNVPRRNSSLHRRNSSLHTGMENYDPSQGLRYENNGYLEDIPKLKKEVELIAEPDRNKDVATINTLIVVHTLIIDEVFHELIKGRKTHHYAWWIFPNDKTGDADPFKTMVTSTTANKFLSNINHDKWKRVLEIIIKSFDKIPPVDYGRIKYFCKFWKLHLKYAPWLKEIIDELEGLLKLYYFV